MAIEKIKSIADVSRSWFLRNLKHILIALAFLAIGILSIVLLMSLKSKVKQKPPEVVAPLVTVQQIKAKDIQMIVSGFGTVKADVQVEIVPQVAGRIVDIHPQFKAGGFIAANETIIQIDPRDYELAVRQANAAVAQAEVQLEIEQSEATVARQEWNQLNPDTEPTSPLVLRLPQIKQATSDLASAQAKLDTAKLNLERTKISMPIDICVLSEQVDLGQFANAGVSTGSAFGITKALVEIPLEDKDLAWFDIPSNPVSFNGGENVKHGSDVQIKADFAGQIHIWPGTVARTTGQVDERSRLITVVVEIENPFHTDDRPALLPGTFVEVNIIGKTIPDAFKIPREAIHSQNKLWLARENKLYIVEFDIIRADNDYVYIQQGIVKDGDYIITSPLDAVTNGMDIRIENLPAVENQKIPDANSTEKNP